jgi:hypothetical protein
VPEVTVEFERSLCDADTVTLFNSPSTMSQSPDTAMKALQILEKLWLLDSSLGVGLNWKSLSNEGARAHVVMQLAPAIRNRQSTIPLQRLQVFASAYARWYLKDGTTLGIGLIGDTDAPGQFLLLKRVVESPDRNARRVAIAALGDMCSKNTKLLLEKLATDKGGLDAEDRKRAVAHLKRRTTQMGSLWCSHATAPEPKHREGET